MLRLKTFEQFDRNQLMVGDWRQILPQSIEVTKGLGGGETLTRRFRLGNIMKNANMTQVIYEAEQKIFGHPDEMSLDVYYYEDHRTKMTIDVIYGDLVACEFTVLAPGQVDVVEDTSYGSKFDPSNTVFSLSDETIESLLGFINQVDGFRVTKDKLDFLSSIQVDADSKKPR